MVFWLLSFPLSMISFACLFVFSRNLRLRCVLRSTRYYFFFSTVGSDFLAAPCGSSFFPSTMPPIRTPPTFQLTPHHSEAGEESAAAAGTPGAAALAAGTGGRAKRTRVKAIMEVREGGVGAGGVGGGGGNQPYIRTWVVHSCSVCSTYCCCLFGSEFFCLTASCSL